MYSDRHAELVGLAKVSCESVYFCYHDSQKYLPKITTHTDNVLPNMNKSTLV